MAYSAANASSLRLFALRLLFLFQLPVCWVEFTVGKKKKKRKKKKKKKRKKKRRRRCEKEEIIDLVYI